jgi:hypothetical protein
VGWRERDWARWTDEERARYLSSSSGVAGTGVRVHEPKLGYGACQRSRLREVTLLAMAVSLAASLATWHFHLFRFVVNPAPSHAPRSTIVYGSGLAHLNGQSQEMTCTAMTTNAQGSELCTTWTLLLPGQQAVQATSLPAGASCSAVTADQQAGRWACAPAPATP